MINPGSPIGGVVNGHEIQSLAQGRLPLGGAEVVAAPTRVDVGQPATAPRRRPSTRCGPGCGPSERERAWYDLQQQANQPPELVIAVRLAEGTDPAAAASLMGRLVNGAARRSDLVGAWLFRVAGDALVAATDRGTGVPFHPVG